MHYRLKFEPDDNGTILVTSSDFPLVTFGDDEEEAFRNATDAAEAILQSMIDNREDIPPPNYGSDRSPRLRLPLQVQLKVGLYIKMRAAGMTPADLMRMLAWNRESVDRLFRLNHNSKTEQLEAGFRALGEYVTVSFDKVAAA